MVPKDEILRTEIFGLVHNGLDFLLIFLDFREFLIFGDFLLRLEIKEARVDGKLIFPFLLVVHELMIYEPFFLEKSGGVKYSL